MMPPPSWAAAARAVALLAACDTPRATEPRATEPRATEPRAAGAPSAALARAAGDGDLASAAREVRVLAAQRGIFALAAPTPVRRPLVLLGRALAFDPILSGGRDVSCMTCHVPAFATGDGRSLSIGQGATGLGPAREHPLGVFIPR